MSWRSDDGRRRPSRSPAARVDVMTTYSSTSPGTSPGTSPDAVGSATDGSLATASAADGAAIRLTGLRKSFGSVHAVRGVDLTVAPGEVVAFLGPNGAGKSTTIDLLLGLTEP